MGLPALIRGLRRRGPSPVMSALAGVPGVTKPSPTVVRPPPPPPTPSGKGDALSRLEELQGLRSSGAITEAEFEAKKAEILREM
ncbi:MAG: SHOCT domain-containing protein [Thermoleophilaceae bacterium]|nr:SHOCT domain-containing protein [Thermoleophilaceae bacterium]